MEQTQRLRRTIQDAMACTPFAEVGEPCPSEDQVRELVEQANVRMQQRMDPDCALFHEKGDTCFL